MVLRSTLCVTSETGECQAKVRYGFGYASWPWSQCLRKLLPKRERFEVLVIKDGQTLASQALIDLTPLQLTGLEPRQVYVDLGPHSD